MGGERHRVCTAQGVYRTGCLPHGVCTAQGVYRVACSLHRTTQTSTSMFIEFGFYPEASLLPPRFDPQSQPSAPQLPWFDFAEVLVSSFSGVTKEQIRNGTARSESEMWQSAFCLDVQSRASVVGVTAFAEATRF